jgi:hypothetical protein
MQSTRNNSRSSKGSANGRTPKKHDESKQRNHRTAGRDSLASSEFQHKVLTLHKAFEEMSKPSTPSTAKGPLLFRQTEKGTLEQVGREADNAWAGVKRIMSLLNVEKKHCFYSGSQSVNQSGVVQDLSGQISQGVGGSQRTGDSLKLSRVRGRFRAASQGQYNTIQIVIGRSKDGIPTVADLFQLVGSAQSGLSYQNDDQDQANKFLWHHIVLVAPSTSVAAVFREIDLKIDADTLFVAGTTTATSGALWCAMISDAAASLPSCEFAFDMEFVDN